MSADFEEDTAPAIPDHIWDQLFSNYDKTDEDIAQRVKDAFSEQDSCLICLEEIARHQAVWSCSVCYNIYHLVCVQRWAKEGIQLLAPSDEESELTARNWCCPKCRTEYAEKDVPRKYFCFCGKLSNPPVDHWILPHSCGDSCGRKLGCDHLCKLLCHPGACPPCPKTVRVSCYCGKMPPATRRCGNKGWSCQKACHSVLPCKFHMCPVPCHPGDCPPCAEKSEQPCACRKNKRVQPCSEAAWNCDSICGKLLSCCRHKCEKPCHAPPCEPCVPVGARTCPCGKTEYEDIECIDDQPVCGDTCGRLQECGYHSCLERCHKAKCPDCVQVRVKSCRCGARQKQIACAKPFICDTKCKRQRNCKRHNCNKRCCDGRSCPPCDQPCGRTLPCKNHKCTSPCHSGMCYPCPLMVQVTCPCGKAKISVPCGKEKRTRPPRCKGQCLRKPPCHHELPSQHRCHLGDCPPCSQRCKKGLPCSHECLFVCHSAVLTDTSKNKLPQGPILPCDIPKVKLELVNYPCPPCAAAVNVSCAGGHEVGQFKCSEAKPKYCCGRPCGRQLPCGNHKCATLCHSPEDKPCDECREACSLPRPTGCAHVCPKPCHPSPCPPCKQMLRKNCHCGMMIKHIPCLQIRQLSSGGAGDASQQEEMDRLLCCGDTCPKLMPCEHRCLKICHTGPCSDPTECPKKVAIFCPCKRIKKMVKCPSAKNFDVSCDKICEEKRQEELRKKAALEPQVSHEEVISFKPKKAKRKRNREAVDEQDRPWGKYAIAAAVVVIFGIIAFYILKM